MGPVGRRREMQNSATKRRGESCSGEGSPTHTLTSIDHVAFGPKMAGLSHLNVVKLRGARAVEPPSPFVHLAITYESVLPTVDD